MTDIAEEIEGLRASLKRTLGEAEAWLYEARGARPDQVIGYDGWADEAKRLIGQDVGARGGWTERKDFPSEDGWYLVVVEGHGTRYQKVDLWNGDDMQWKAEHDDENVRVTHYRPLLGMP